MAGMGIRIKEIGDDIEILMMTRIKRSRDLPKEYLGGYPRTFLWDDGRGVSVVLGHRNGYIIKQGQVIRKTAWEYVLDGIRKSGDRLHEIIQKKPPSCGCTKFIDI